MIKNNVDTDSHLTLRMNTAVLKPGKTQEAERVTRRSEADPLRIPVRDASFQNKSQQFPKKYRRVRRRLIFDFVEVSKGIIKRKEVAHVSAKGC